MKLLYILNLTSRVNSFSMSSLLAAKALGVDFHIAGNWSYLNEDERRKDEERFGIHIYQIDFRRNPLHPLNVRAYRQLDRIVDREKFDAIHCNTPIGGITGRLLGLKYGIKKVIYQAHGFHFYHGAPLLSWILYYPAEKWMGLFTDDLICINQEDYDLAKKHLNLRRGGRLHYVPGVGIDIEKHKQTIADNIIKRKELAIPEDKPLMLSVGELNRNKNHVTVIRALPMLPDVHYAIAGKGPLGNSLIKTAIDLGVADRVHLLGYRTDLVQIYPVADVFCLPSIREGLCTAVMEAMASGLPVVCSDIRGNRDLVIEQKGGHLVKPLDVFGYASAIKDILVNTDTRAVMALHNKTYIQEFTIIRVTEMMQDMYRVALSI